MCTTSFGTILFRSNSAFNCSRQCHSIVNLPRYTQSKFLGFVHDLNGVLDVETIHGQVTKNAGVEDLGVGNYILSLYVKFRCFNAASRVFDEMNQRDVRSYTILISGFARCGLFRRALDSFDEMLDDEVLPNQFTLSSVLRSCSGLGLVRVGKMVHGWIIKNAVEFDDALKNSVLDLYIKHGEVESSRRVFELIKDGNVISRNIMIGWYIQVGDIESAIDLFRSKPAKDTDTWNTVISRLLQNGFQRDALNLLHEMVKLRVPFGDFTFSIALTLASSLSVLELGRQLHCQLIHTQLQNNEFVRSSLIDMYGKCGRTEQASSVFEQRSMMETVSWSSMIAGFMQNSMWEKALKTFRDMLSQGITPDKFSLTSVVSASADCGNLRFGQQIHAMILKTGHSLDVILSSSFVDMYAKCGSLYDADAIFKKAEERNVVMWTSLISGFAIHGKGNQAINLFEQMKGKAVVPNALTYIAVVTACSHTGMIDEGLKYYKEMKEVYKIEPLLEHYTCVVDLFGRAGRLEDIKKFISENGLSHHKLVWKAFLSSCGVHKNVQLGIWVAERLMELDPLDQEPYVLLSSIWADHGKWEESARLRSLMQKRAIKKDPGQAWIT